MPKRIPIKAAKDVAKQYDLLQVILLAWDGEQTHVVTYGTTLKDCGQAAIGGNKIKRWMNWPEELCQTKPARIRKKENNNGNSTD